MGMEDVYGATKNYQIEIQDSAITGHSLSFTVICSLNSQKYRTSDMLLLKILL